MNLKKKQIHNKVYQPLNFKYVYVFIFVYKHICHRVVLQIICLYKLRKYKKVSIYIKKC